MTQTNSTYNALSVFVGYIDSKAIPERLTMSDPLSITPSCYSNAYLATSLVKCLDDVRGTFKDRTAINTGLGSMRTVLLR